jgi:hydroxyquinol 1,2-dioxygenase
MRVIDENSITEAALDQMAGTPNPRLREIMSSLVRHLHDFAREVDLTADEWLQGISFLTAVGQKCSDRRQEFILLSDTLGLSSLVNSLHDRRAVDCGTKSSLLGPFYRQVSPQMKLGDSIVAGAYPNAQEMCVYGRVVDAAGKGIADASVEIWQPDETGTYDMQKKGIGADLRGTFHTDAEGRYYLRTILPAGYMSPMDGPVGNMIRAQRRHGYRPAHIHFVVGAPGHREVVTALYITGDDHLDSDTVFGVTESLVVRVNDKDSTSPMPALSSIRFDLQLASGSVAKSGRVGTDPAQIGKSAEPRRFRHKQFS